MWFIGKDRTKSEVPDVECVAWCEDEADQVRNSHQQAVIRHRSGLASDEYDEEAGGTFRVWPTIERQWRGWQPRDERP